MAEALERLWLRFLPETRARIAILESAAQSLAAGALDPGQTQAAAGAAHKLAGTLGTFGLNHGTAVARELEQLYARGNGLTPETAASLAGELRQMVESRTAPST